MRKDDEEEEKKEEAEEGREEGWGEEHKENDEELDVLEVVVAAKPEKVWLQFLTGFVDPSSLSLRAFWEASWKPLRVSEAPLGASWASLGRMFAVSGPSWGLLAGPGASLSVLGASGILLRPLGGLLGASWRPLGAV